MSSRSKSSLPPSSVDPGQSAIPIARINKAIKADRDVKICSKEAVFLIGKATEIMLGKLTQQAYQHARMDKRAKMVRYDDLAAATHSSPSWFYLGEVIPTALPLSSALALRAANEDLTTSIPSSAAGAGKKTPKMPSTVGQKRVIKSKAAKNGGRGTAGLGLDGGELLGEVRKTRGKKISLPAGEGGGPEPDDFEDEAYLQQDDGEGDEEYNDEEMEGGAGGAPGAGGSRGGSVAAMQIDS
ncbi:hypothetical protein JCM11251_000409 [Rhodosporidiobolus azoricus]